MKKNLLFLLKILSGLLFPTILFVGFIDQDIGVFYDYLLVLYICFWVFPIIFLDKVHFFKLCILNVFVLILSLYILSLYAQHLERPRIMELYDKKQEIIKDRIIKELSTTNTNYINSVQDYIKSNPDIRGEDVDFYKCLYLSGIENGNGFILAYKYNSQSSKNQNGSDYFIFKSTDKYVITNEMMREILGKINRKCGEL